MTEEQSPSKRLQSKGVESELQQKAGEDLPATQYSKQCWTKGSERPVILTMDWSIIFVLFREALPHLTGKYRENEEELLPAGHLGPQPREHLEPGLFLDLEMAENS